MFLLPVRASPSGEGELDRLLKKTGIHAGFFLSVCLAAHDAVKAGADGFDGYICDGL